MLCKWHLILTLIFWANMQIKTTVKYLRMAIIKKSTNNKCWRGCGEKGILLHCWWGCKLIQPLWRTVWRCLKKLKIELPYDPAIPLLGIYPEKTVIQKDTCTSVFIVALFIIAGTGKHVNVHQQMNGWRCGTYIQWNIIQPLKGTDVGHL